MSCWSIPSNGEFRNSTPIIQYNEVAISIIDTTQFPVSDYFTDASYDNYPVIGVSDKHAQYYAAWKTRKNSEKHEKEKPSPQYNSLTDAQKDYVAYNSVQNKSKERILLDKNNKGNFQGFYLVIYPVTSVKRPASLN